MLAAAPARPEDPSAHAEATLQRVSQASVGQQRAWLRQLEARLAWAGALTLKPDEAERERARVAELLRQKMVPWKTLVDLVVLLEQRERAAVARLVRQYRAQVYETFKRQQDVLVRRQEAWYHVWSVWAAAGSPPEQQDRLLAWLVAAIRGSMPDAIGPLPPDPVFVVGDEAAPPRIAVDEPGRVPLYRQSPQRLGPLSTAVPDPVAPLVVPTRLSRGADVRIPAAELNVDMLDGRASPRLPRGPRTTATREPEFKRGAPLPTPQLVYDRAARLIRPEADMPFATAVAGPAARDGGHPVEAVETGAGGRSSADLPARRVEVAEPEDQPGPSPPYAVRPRDRAQPAPMIPGDDVAVQVPRLPRMEAEPPRAVPVVAPPPIETPEPPNHRAAPGSAKPDSAAAQSTAEPADDRVRVNVEELSVRIAGSNLSLRTLEAELETSRQWSAGQLDAVLSRLDILVLRQRDLALFRELITPEEQARVGRLESPRRAVSQLAVRIAEARRRAAGSEFQGSEAERRTELVYLDEMAQRLATIAAEK